MYTKSLIVTLVLIWKSTAQVQDNRLLWVNEEYIKTRPSLRCYDCNSEYDPRCGDPFNPYSIGEVNCSDKQPPEHLLDPNRQPNLLWPTVCRKIVQKIDNKKRVIRECGYIRDDRDDKPCVRRTGTKNVEIIYCACTHSLCNGGSIVTMSVPIVLMVLIKWL